MKNHTNVKRRSVVAVTAALLAGSAIGVTALGSSQADTPNAASPAPAAVVRPSSPINQSPPSTAPEPKVWSPKVTAYESAGSPADAEARAAVERTRLANVDIDADQARTVGDPSGETKTWTVVPIKSGICAVFGDGNVLCGHDERLAISGASVIWSTPSPVEVQEGTGAYAFRGIAVDEVTGVAVINQDGAELEKAVPKGSVFAVTVAASKRPTALRLTGSDGKVSVIQVN